MKYTKAAGKTKEVITLIQKIKCWLGYHDWDYCYDSVTDIHGVVWLRTYAGPLYPYRDCRGCGKRQGYFHGRNSWQ